MSEKGHLYEYIDPSPSQKGVCGSHFFIEDQFSFFYVGHYCLLVKKNAKAQVSVCTKGNYHHDNKYVSRHFPLSSLALKKEIFQLYVYSNMTLKPKRDLHIIENTCLPLCLCFLNNISKSTRPHSKELVKSPK